MPQLEREGQRRKMKKGKKRGTINNNAKRRQDSPLLELMRKLGCGELESKNPPTWRPEWLQTLEASTEYQSLLKEYEEECRSSMCDHTSRQIMVDMYLHIRRLFPEMEWLDILAKILHDTMEAWVERAINETLLLDWKRKRKRDRRASPRNRRSRRQHSSQVDEDRVTGGEEETEEAGGTTIVPAICSGRFQAMPRRRQDSGHLTWIPYNGEPAECMCTPVNDKNEVIEASLDRDELKCIFGGLEA
jgi:hypothetical protein